MSTRVAFRALLLMLGLLVINPPHDALRAQSLFQQERFEVASVKPNPTTIAELIRSKGWRLRTFTMSGMPLSKRIARIDSELSAPVTDKTGLNGLFDAVLEFQSSQPTPVTPGPLPDMDFQAVPVGFALERQLGLKLAEVKGPMTFVIIDSAELPAPD